LNSTDVIEKAEKPKEIAEENPLKSAIAVALVFILGILSGTYLSRPPKVHAIGSRYYINVQKLEEGQNVKSSLAGSRYLGFSCTQTDCYVASTE